MNEKEALQKAESYCSASEHCCSEIKEKLRRWEVTSEYEKTIIDSLVRDGFIDEERYAQAFAHDKLRFSKWGRLKIAVGLRQKQIPQTIISIVLDNIDENEYQEILEDLMKSHANRVKGNTEYERSVKLMKYLIGRGFEMDMIRKCMNFSEE